MKKGKSYSKKHSKIVTDYENQKAKHLEKLATIQLDNDEKFRKLGEKKIKGNFLKNF